MVDGLGQDALGEQYASEPSAREEAFAPVGASAHEEEPAHEGVVDAEVSALVGAVDLGVELCLAWGILVAEACALEAASSNEEAPGREALALEISAREEALVLVEGSQDSEATLVASGLVPVVVTLEAFEVCHEAHLEEGDEVEVEIAAKAFARGEFPGVGSLEREAGLAPLHDSLENLSLAVRCVFEAEPDSVQLASEPVARHGVSETHVY
ncbi:unnamed protein product [Clonostachys rosea]|uniref:Uncharacterized protein n=1 Tax=Bionectria ochroleuca TaxID=29856 RepID=A0ABY6TYP3_BIOOC|nr:unnamed protein product [Clonostachys rosea]